MIAVAVTFPAWLPNALGFITGGVTAAVCLIAFSAWDRRHR